MRGQGLRRQGAVSHAPFASCSFILLGSVGAVALQTINESQYSYLVPLVLAFVAVLEFIVSCTQLARATCPRSAVNGHDSSPELHPDGSCDT